MTNRDMKDRKMAKGNWHCWTRPYENYPPDKAGSYEAQDGFAYRYDDCNEDYYSILQDEDVYEVMEQIRAGAKLDVYRLQHFHDDDSDAVREILALNALEGGGMGEIVDRLSQQLESPVVAELLAIHCLDSGWSVDELILEAAEQYMCDGDCEESFGPFVVACERLRQKERLEKSLTPKVEAGRRVKV